MKGAKLLSAVMVLFAFASTAVLAQANSADAAAAITTQIEGITNIVLAVAGGLAVLAAIVVGVMMFQAKDPAERDQLKDKLKYIIIGLVIIVVAKPVVSTILSSAA